MRYQHATEENDRQIAVTMDAMLLDARANRAMDAPPARAAEVAVEVREADASPLPAALVESGRRESNPRSQLGNGPKELRGLTKN
jgi:hypothetical protein